MKKIILVTITTLLVSCKHGKQTEPQQTMGVDTAAIELRTNRKLISIDTLELNSLQRNGLRRYLSEEREHVKQIMEFALDYEIGDGFEVLHFLPDEYRCFFICSDLHIQLYKPEFDKLYKYLLTFKGESESEIKDKENNIAHRTTVSLRDCFVANLDTDCRSKRYHDKDVTLRLDYKTRSMTYHNHNSYFCQTHLENYYNRLWKEQQKKRQEIERNNKH